MWLMVVSARAADTYAHELVSQFTAASPAWSRTFQTLRGVTWRQTLLTSPNTVTLDLGRTYPAGTYYIWLLAWTSHADKDLDLSFGGITSTDAFTNFVWSRRTAVPVSSWSTVDFIFTDTAGGNQDWNIGGFMVSTNANEAFSDLAGAVTINTSSAIFNYSLPTTTNLTVSSSNLVADSGFELELGRYWGTLRGTETTSDFYPEFLHELTFTNEAHSGSRCLRINDDNAFRVVSAAPIRLPGARTKYKVSLSFWTKGDRASYMKFYPLFGNASGFASNDLHQIAFTPTGTWTRYTTNVFVSPVPTREWALDFALQSQTDTGTNACLIDDVQVQFGDLTDWSPEGQVEFQLFNANYLGLYNIGETPGLNVRTYNYGASASRTLTWEVFNQDHEMVSSGTTNLTAAAELRTNTIPIAALGAGSYHAHAWLNELPARRDEVNFSVAPLAGLSSVETNRPVGVHPMQQAGILTTNRWIGLHSARSLSPFTVARMAEINPATNTFVWDKFDYILGTAEGLAEVLLSLNEGAPPSWAQTNGIFPHLSAVSNYIYQVVDRAEGFGIRNVESFNEPPTFWTPAQYALLLEQEILAAKAANPDCVFWACGGMFSDTTCSNAIALLPPAVAAEIDGITCHLYPSGDTVDVAAWIDTDSRFSGWRNLANALGVPVMNTESGTPSPGIYRTANVAWTLDGTYVFPGRRTEVDVSEVYERPYRTPLQALRSLGNGFSKFYSYDARWWEMSIRQRENAFSILTPDDSWKPDIVPLLWINNLLTGAISLGPLTHASQSTIEAYLWQVGARAILGVVSQQKTNYTLTLTNSGVGVVNLWGEIESTNSASVTVSRHPKFIISTVLGTNELRIAYLAGSYAVQPDVLAPNVSIDVSPHGNYTSLSNVIFKWTAVDATDSQADLWQTNVTTRWKVNGATDWSEWSATRIVELTNTFATGTFNLEIQARDRHANTSATMSGPAFSVGGAERIIRAVNAYIGTVRRP